ncbi:MAG: hypothetical protein RML45_00020 [Acetobacteraceae bacterium]|nr:hypothetical protein [Acetobacteraceae bacterium]
MGTSGGRPDIGLSTANVVNWLLGAEPYAAEFALGQARAASAIPWHFYDMPRGIPITTENYPALRPWAWVTPGRPGDPTSHGLTQRPVTDTGWGWNTSHQPDLSFVPYLLTGERWIYDNLMSQASASLLAATPTPRLETERPVINDQIRALAWSMRQIEHAAWSAVDGSAEQRFFDRAADANWNYLLQKVPEWNARHGEIAGLIYAEYTYGHHTPVWQNYMVANVAGMAALRGREKAAQLLDWMGNYLIGVINSEAKGLPPYNVITGDVPIRWNGEFLDTWAELADVLRSRGQLAETSFPVGHLQEYYRMYAGALAHLHMVTGREDAKRAFEKLFALGPVPGANPRPSTRPPRSSASSCRTSGRRTG